MKVTTGKLLEKLRHEWPSGLYQVDIAEHKDDSDVIHLKDNLVLAIDEYASLTMVSLDECNDVGGAVTHCDWVIDSSDALNAVISVALQVLERK